MSTGGEEPEAMKAADANWPQMTIMFSGVFLIVVGVALVVVQMWLEVTAPEIKFAPRGLAMEGAGAKASVNTTYVGLVLAVLGAFLEMVGYLAARPWKKEGS